MTVQPQSYAEPKGDTVILFSGQNSDSGAVASGPAVWFATWKITTDRLKVASLGLQTENKF